MGAGDAVSAVSARNAMPKLSWASKTPERETVRRESSSPLKDVEGAMSKSFKELMIEDQKRGGKEGMTGGKTTTTTSKARTLSTSGVEDIKDDFPSSLSSKSKRKISFGLMGDHQAQPRPKEKSKSKETIPEEPKTPTNPWTNFQAKNESVVGPGSEGGGSGPPLSPTGKGVTSVGVLTTSPNASSAAVSLSRVISEEAEAKERWKRETQKPLHLIQIEEQALKELATHYEMIYGRDGEERIEVERAVEEYRWTPLWRNAANERK